MSTTSQRTLMSAFEQAAGGWSNAEANNQELIEALGQAVEVTNAQIAATGANTDALGESMQARSSGGSAAADAIGTAGQLLSGGLSGGFSALPLVSLFEGLFSGGSTEQTGTLIPYSLPPSRQLETTTNGGGVTWGEGGLPRASTSAGGGQQVTVQVQAMDSQSFLDHSEDIAQAVRKAMLNMNGINDVITNL